MSNPWIQHVKAVAQKLGLNYNMALRDPRTKNSYKKMTGGKFSFSKLGKDALNISKKIVKVGVPAMAGIGTTIETGNPMAGMAAAKGASELTNYLTGGKKSKKPKMMLKDVKQLCKQNGIRLSSNGKPFNKKQLMIKLHQMA